MLLILASIHKEFARTATDLVWQAETWTPSLASTSPQFKKNLFGYLAMELVLLAWLHSFPDCNTVSYGLAVFAM